MILHPFYIFSLQHKKTGTLAGQKYVYEANGNLTKDLNNKITVVSYNFINLLVQVTKDGQNVHYVYKCRGREVTGILREFHGVEL